MSVLDQPALQRFHDAPDSRSVRPVRTSAMVPFRDRTVRRVTVAEWRTVGGGRWACLLRWGSGGELREGWYMHDPALVEPDGE